MTLTVKLVNPERALSQTSAAWYAVGDPDEPVFVGEVALGDSRVAVYADGKLRAHGPNGPIRSGDALREEYGSDTDLEIAGQCQEISIDNEPWFVLEITGQSPGGGWDPVGVTHDGEEIWQYFEPYHSLADAVEGAVAYLKTGDPEGGCGEEVAGLLAGALKHENSKGDESAPASEPEPEQAVVWEPASDAGTHVVIRYTGEDPPQEWEIVSNDPTKIAQFMAETLRDWCVDDEIEITINGENY